MATRDDTPEPPIASVSALDDELRRGMYDFTRHARRPVTRDEAAAEVGISRKLAAFHLDKLVDAGLLTARFEPVGGLRKVGRTPKVYEPAEVDIRISIPPRQHDLLADILLEAVLTAGEAEAARHATLRTARERGNQLGAAEREQARPGKLGLERALTLAEAALGRYGFEPARESPGCVRLLNCPFHPLAAQYPDLVCAINHTFLDGFRTGLDAPAVHATLAPRPGECCVQLHRAGENP